MDKSYSVYRHIFPTGEIYIGITNGKVEDRWNSGFGYESQRKFFKRIVAVGWDNIKHEIVGTNLDESEARGMERRLIAEARCKSLNTQWKVGDSLDIKYDRLIEDDKETRKKKFREFADYWLEKAKYRDTVPLDWEINEKYVDLTYFTCEQNAMCRDVFRVIIPFDITYIDLYNYLTYECDFTKSEHLVCEKLGEVAV